MKKATHRQQVRESYLDDIQILRNRGLSSADIAAELSKGERRLSARQVDRWAVLLKQERRWRALYLPVTGDAKRRADLRNQNRGWES